MNPPAESIANAAPVIEVSGLDFAYNRHQPAVLQQVNLRIDHLDSICLVGPNGGGKTTLLKLILGLLTPQRGQIRVLGRTPAEVRLRLGYVPQYAHYDPLFPVTVMDVVLMGRLGRQPLGWYRQDDRQAARQALALMKLEPLAEQRFASLSGGQRQRTLIARALASDAEILLLDEPTANIDLKSEQSLFALLKELNQSRTVVVVTHDIGFASSFFQRVACVNRQVVTHPVSELNGQMIQELYGGDVAMIRHDHTCVGGHCRPGESGGV
ncbi:metal ABC transporter ATP-binding protein [Desulfurivibrio alkaliphilus]|uniref:ABC transporter related protein n=1 Tax=Desulfurivibrio alkaliphilus (strain DSM 19089 / UNIQEM U267 / AHT2) TaxID=589865 RepID=D6Z1D3_DESAT|nr:ABC transporter ATP-binding protein [Desulfurivibrio alkaliphilus]ADH85388.1 ABC transporter related protein [Desulfurivibrio alkaliphilus AHT 2]